MLSRTCTRLAAVQGVLRRDEEDFVSMVTKREVLELIAERSEDGRKTSYRSLMRWLPLSFEAACGHLERLWRERLIEATTPRLPGFRFRLEPGEPIGDLR